MKIIKPTQRKAEMSDGKKWTVTPFEHMELCLSEFLGFAAT